MADCTLKLAEARLLARKSPELLPPSDSTPTAGLTAEGREMLRQFNSYVKGLRATQRGDDADWIEHAWTSFSAGVRLSVVIVSAATTGGGSVGALSPFLTMLGLRTAPSR